MFVFFHFFRVFEKVNSHPTVSPKADFVHRFRPISASTGIHLSHRWRLCSQVRVRAGPGGSWVGWCCGSRVTWPTDWVKLETSRIFHLKRFSKNQLGNLGRTWFSLPFFQFTGSVDEFLPIQKKQGPPHFQLWSSDQLIMDQGMDIWSAERMDIWSFSFWNRFDSDRLFGWLAGGFSNIFSFSPRFIWGNHPIWWSYFSNGVGSTTN